ncbi:TPA: chemotaxis protein CheW [Morganella morganii]|uniref:chemotaxis protein CheW n=1 Tax=Morganella morganii TaxID=582 RepID=UPI00388D51E6|nr:chemotaxis protein CheW [Morganella morganii]
MDITEFYQTFFDEADELLRDMEQHLLELDPRDPDSEQLNAIFRSAHSIKGGAATFGFTLLQKTTHTLENLLDKARHDELTLTPDIIDVFLDTKDVMGSQLDAYKSDTLPDEASFNRICEVLGHVEQSVADAAVVTETAAPEPVSETAEITAGSEESSTVPETGFSHHFTFTLSKLKESEVALLADELSLFGTVYKTEQGTDTLKVWLGTNTAIDDISGVLCFVVDDSQIAYEETPAAELTAMLAADNTPAEAEEETVSAPVAVPAPAAASSSAPAARKAPAAAAKNKGDSGSIRVAVEKVDQAEYAELLSSIVQLERNSRALQESVMSIRMMPMDYVFSRFPRMVRDIASKLNKKIELKVEGSSTELDKSLIERIIDPLTHLVRNSLDHGIEKPDVRAANGKPEAGTLTLAAEHQSGNICIEVRDDGAGLNRERILAKARQQGMDVHDNMTNDEIAMLIMAPGFSTAEVITDVSGRGVGMDVVKRNIQDMGGRIQIGFTEGRGTVTRILLPLTLAILDGMSVKVADDVFIVPLSAIISTLQPRQEDIYRLAGEEKMLLVRGEYLPLVEMHQVFGIEEAERDLAKSIALIVQNAGNRYALLVDRLIGQQQVVVKNVESNYRKIPGISAATIMGDGSVALIIDVAELQRMNNEILCKKKMNTSHVVMQ